MRDTFFGAAAMLPRAQQCCGTHARRNGRAFAPLPLRPRIHAPRRFRGACLVSYMPLACECVDHIAGHGNLAMASLSIQAPTLDTRLLGATSNALSLSLERI